MKRILVTMELKISILRSFCNASFENFKNSVEILLFPFFFEISNHWIVGLIQIGGVKQKYLKSIILNAEIAKINQIIQTANITFQPFSRRLWFGHVKVISGNSFLPLIDVLYFNWREFVRNYLEKNIVFPIFSLWFFEFLEFQTEEKKKTLKKVNDMRLWINRLKTSIRCFFFLSFHSISFNWRRLAIRPCFYFIIRIAYNRRSPIFFHSSRYQW